jgi:hypothetical protein
MLLPRMIIGLGSGRCGTFSLYRLLEAQHCTYAVHEDGYLTWEPNFREMWRLVYDFQGRAAVRSNPIHIVATVAFFWLNYVEKLVEMPMGQKFICLRRDKEETVASFMAFTGEKNHWTDTSSDCWADGDESTYWHKLWPSYDLPKREALARYYDDYYKQAEVWENKFPKIFKIFPIDVFNSKKGVRSLLDFAGIPRKHQVVHVGVRLNTREKKRGEIDVPA